MPLKKSSSEKVAELHQVDNVPNEQLVKVLEDVLDQARKGEIIGLVAYGIGLEEGHHVRSGVTYIEAVGYCHRLAHLLNEEWDRG